MHPLLDQRPSLSQRVSLTKSQLRAGFFVHLSGKFILSHGVFLIQKNAATHHIS